MMKAMKIVLGTMTFGESVFAPEVSEFLRIYRDAGAVKRAVRADPSLRFHRVRLPDGTQSFDLLREGKLLERHLAQV